MLNSSASAEMCPSGSLKHDVAARHDAVVRRCLYDLDHRRAKTLDSVRQLAFDVAGSGVWRFALPARSAIAEHRGQVLERRSGAGHRVAGWSLRGAGGPGLSTCGRSRGREQTRTEAVTIAITAQITAG